MTNHTISLPENVYRRMLAIAKAQGVSPVSWIASKVSEHSDIAKFSDESSSDSADLPASSEPNKFTTPVETAQMSVAEVLAEIIESVDDEVGDVDDKKSELFKKAVEKDDYFGEALIEDMRRQGLHFP